MLIDVKVYEDLMNSRLVNPESENKLSELQYEIIEEAKKIATNKTSSCYSLTMSTRQLIELEKGIVQS